MVTKRTADKSDSTLNISVELVLLVFLGIASASGQTTRPPNAYQGGEPPTVRRVAEFDAAARKMSVGELDVAVRNAPYVWQARRVLDELARRPGEEAAGVLRRFEADLPKSGGFPDFTRDVRGAARVAIAMHDANGDRRAMLDAFAKLLAQPENTGAPRAVALKLYDFPGPDAVENLRQAEGSGIFDVRLARIRIEYRDRDDEGFVKGIVADMIDAIGRGASLAAEGTALGSRPIERTLPQLRKALAEERADLPDELRAKVHARLESMVRNAEQAANVQRAASTRPIEKSSR